MNQVAGERYPLYTADQLRTVLDRMAARMAGLLAGAEDPLLLGILRRGDPLAAMLQDRLKLRHGLEVPRYSLRLKRYGDDLALLHPETALTENAEFTARDVSRSTVLIVDDVLYQGHSLVRVLAYLAQRGARAIHAAVLVDRCVAQVPVRAAIVGLRLQVAPGDVVECSVPPYEDDLRIDLLRPLRPAEVNFAKSHGADR
jgi:pyrimidine operon attenuation protein/uracil phosphoribosyltransferase